MVALVPQWPQSVTPIKPFIHQCIYILIKSVENEKNRRLKGKKCFFQLILEINRKLRDNESLIT